MREPRNPTRRALLLGTFAVGACLSVATAADAEEERPGNDKRPQKQDLLVFAEGDRAGEVIKPNDLQLNAPPTLAWPRDPDSAVVRDGSRLNEILVVRLASSELDDATTASAADGIVAYSAVCTHAGCPVTAWMKASEGDREVFKCMCHNSEFDPRHAAQVVFGPAPRHLAALPLVIVDGSLVVAGTFVGKVGAQQG
jgi:rieske iron-sulfur protein